MSELPGYIFDHTERALGELVTKFSGKARIEALVVAFTNEVQELEDAIWACIAERLLDTAVGRQLDQWGEIVGEQRGGLTDGEYRAFLQARILSNLSQGEPGRLIEVLSTLTGGARIRYMTRYPAGMAFEYVRPEPTTPARRKRINRQMEAIAPAGVEIDYITEAGPDYFGFADDPDALGFDEGVFAEVI